MKKAHVTKHVLHPALRHEACALLLLKGHPSTPDVYAWGRSQYYEYLVMEQLGRDVGTAGKVSGGLTMRNLVVLAVQMVRRFRASRFVAVTHLLGHAVRCRGIRSLSRPGSLRYQARQLSAHTGQ